LQIKTRCDSAAFSGSDPLAFPGAPRNFWLEICHFAGFELQLKLVSDKGNKLRIGWLAVAFAIPI